MMTRQRILPVALPVTMGQDLDAGFDFDKSRLGGRQSECGGRGRNWPGSADVRRSGRAAARKPAISFAQSPLLDFKWV